MKKLLALGLTAVVVGGISAIGYSLYKRATEPDYLNDFEDDLDDNFADVIDEEDGEE